MQATLSHQPLNATQIFVLQTFATAQTEKERDELTSFYLRHKLLVTCSFPSFDLSLGMGIFVGFSQCRKS